MLLVGGVRDLSKQVAAFDPKVDVVAELRDPVPEVSDKRRLQVKVLEPVAAANVPGHALENLGVQEGPEVGLLVLSYLATEDVILRGT